MVELNARFKPLVLQGIHAFPADLQRRVRDAAVASIVANNPGLKPNIAAVRAWVQANVHFLDPAPMRYSGL